MIVSGDQGQSFRGHHLSQMLAAVEQEGAALKARMETEIPELKSQLQQATENSDFEKAAQLKAYIDKMEPAIALARVKAGAQWYILNEMQNLSKPNPEPKNENDTTIDKTDEDRFKEAIALFAVDFGSYGIGTTAEALIRFHDNEKGYITGTVSARVTTMSLENNYQVLPMGASLGEDGSLVYAGADGESTSAVIDAVYNAVIENQTEQANKGSEYAVRFLEAVEGLKSGNIGGAAPGAITLEVIGATDLNHFKGWPKGLKIRVMLSLNHNSNMQTIKNKFGMLTQFLKYVFVQANGRVDAFIQKNQFSTEKKIGLSTQLTTLTSAGTDHLGSSDMLKEYATQKSTLYNTQAESKYEDTKQSAHDRAYAAYGNELKGFDDWVAKHPDGLAAQKHAPQPSADPEKQIGETDYNAVQAPGMS